MQPHELHPESFSRYPPQGRDFAVKYLSVLQQIPLVVLPVFLREFIEYDWCFPIEQRSFTRQFEYLETLQVSSFASLMAPFSAIRLPESINKIDWVNKPKIFNEQLSALLWSTHQMDDYRKAALLYQEQLERFLVGKAPKTPRFTVVVIGQGVQKTDISLFRLLRPHGTLFTTVRPEDGLATLIHFVNEWAQKHPEQYAHRYIDGGKVANSGGVEQGITIVSYDALAPAASRELNLTENFIEQKDKTGSGGAEAVQSFMAALNPADLGLQDNPKDDILQHFEVRVLTEGAGTQIFSTTFVQWAAREAMRRAQPSTMLVRFAPRQRMAPMNTLLKSNPLARPLDPEGSLIDADMGAYYTWINQQRLPGADRARFLAWFEGHELAVAIAPDLPGGTTSAMSADIGKILEWMN